MDWLNLAQERGTQQASVNTLMKLWFAYNAWNFLTNREIISL